MNHSLTREPGIIAGTSRGAWTTRGKQLLKLALFVILFLFFQEVFRRLLHAINLRQLLAGRPDALHLLVIDVFRFAAVLLALLAVTTIEKRRVSEYGFPLRPTLLSRLAEGVAWGFLAESATMLTLRLAGNVSFQGLDQHGLAAFGFAFLWFSAFLAVGFFEESLFRGYPQFNLTTVIGFWPAALVLSALFWWQHMGNAGETWVGGVDAALAGLTFCLALRRTGSLWFPIGLHAGWDWSETYFYGVPDSGMPAQGHFLNSAFHGSIWMTGGAAGPEASIVDLGVTLIIILLLAKRFPALTQMPSAAS